MRALRIERLLDPSALWRPVATELLRLCHDRQAEGVVPCIVLTGGSGGEGVLRELATHPELESVDWRRVSFLWGDERWAPRGHEDRNDRLADETLFAVVRVNPDLVHRVPASDSGLTLEQAASEYAEVLSGIEGIDLALSGIGPDGHVASLFPGREDLLRSDTDAPGAIPVRDSPKPPPERVSLTLPALNRAARSWLIAAGEGKAGALSALVHRDEPLLPAARLHGTIETVLWADDGALGGNGYAANR